MKIRRSIFWFVVVMVALIALVLWFGKKKPTETPPPTVVETNIVPPTAPAPSAPVSVLIQTNTPPTPFATNAAKQDTGTRMKEGLAEMNDVPIVFYGRLGDQFGDSIAGAEITANVRIYNGVESTMEHLTTVSDGNGMFQINGGKGESLSIMPKKKGYVLAATSTYFKYSYMYPDRFSPDQNNPTLIKMWKLQGPEPLVEINKTYKLHFTNTPINFDLVAGDIVPVGGDLEINVNRPDGVISQQHPQNWSIDLQVIQGGYIGTSPQESAITYAAPESGYQPNGTFGNNNGPNVVDQAFFIRSRNGQVFSKVHLWFHINNTPSNIMYVTFRGVANTNGSRNWEATVPEQ